MQIGGYNSFFIQIVLFALLAFVLLASAASLFIKTAKRTIRASLVEASTGHIVDISQAETSIGRAKACDFVIADVSVSRFHAVLSKRKNGWIIFDTNSTSGVVVNGQKIEKKALLNDGDTINFGKKKYIFYSTAVTTRQQVVSKTRKQSLDNQVKYRKTATKNDDSVKYRKNTSTTRKKNSKSE
ncbi:MAG: FHA domain-containing protein [Clostridia bacterium]|nr:FHA domain-containing protein [Clostridia bacterium]